MLRLYDYLPSQNGYKIRMLLAQLGQPCETVPVAIFRGQSRAPEFLAKNPAGAIPVLEVAATRTDGSGRNLRDCSQWRTESIPGCYDGQGGGDMN
jgi:hypothetical protein